MIRKKAPLLLLTTALLSALTLAQTPPARDFSKENARPSQDWVKDAVIYQIFPRQYSATGDFNGITKDLDRLKTLGVDLLWLMTIHPIGVGTKGGTGGARSAGWVW